MSIAWDRTDSAPVVLQQPKPTGPPSALMCCRVRVDAVAQYEAVQLLLESTGGLVVHLCNAYTLALARRDREFATLLNTAGLNLPDGTPLAWLGRREGVEGFTHATRGADILRDALIEGQDRGTRHYFYGSTPEVLSLLQRQVREFAPRAIICGLESPPMGDIAELGLEQAAGRMAAAGADIVWVGLGTPKQDRAVAALGKHLPAVLVPVGAAFEFLAGTKREAPAWVRGSGWEWLFRLAVEPRRLWRRYLLGNAGFLWGVLHDGVHQVHRLPVRVR
jgi:N-acetylglucosaminyldiphosphoundecaprenol N-acetyl-beta-D-mannosaminyltransferase